MVGVNHEMSRTLLFNEYPTDQRGTDFQHFWDFELGGRCRQRRRHLADRGLDTAVGARCALGSTRATGRRVSRPVVAGRGAPAIPEHGRVRDAGKVERPEHP